MHISSESLFSAHFNGVFNLLRDLSVIIHVNLLYEFRKQFKAMEAVCHVHKSPEDEQRQDHPDTCSKNLDNTWFKIIVQQA